MFFEIEKNRIYSKKCEKYTLANDIIRYLDATFSDSYFHVERNIQRVDKKVQDKFYIKAIFFKLLDKNFSISKSEYEFGNDSTLCRRFDDFFIEDEGICYLKDGKKALDIDIHCNKPLTGLDFYFHYIYFYDTTSLNDLCLDGVKSFNDYNLI